MSLTGPRRYGDSSDCTANRAGRYCSPTVRHSGDTCSCWDFRCRLHNHGIRRVSLLEWNCVSVSCSVATYRTDGRRRSRAEAFVGITWYPVTYVLQPALDRQTIAATVDVALVVSEDTGKSWRCERIAIVAYWHCSVTWEDLAGTYLWSVVIGAVHVLRGPGVVRSPVRRLRKRYSSGRDGEPDGRLLPRPRRFLQRRPHAVLQQRRRQVRHPRQRLPKGRFSLSWNQLLFAPAVVSRVVVDLDLVPCVNHSRGASTKRIERIRYQMATFSRYYVF